MLSTATSAGEKGAGVQLLSRLLLCSCSSSCLRRTVELHDALIRIRIAPRPSSINIPAKPLVALDLA
jgi:hypothetical protein